MPLYEYKCNRCDEIVEEIFDSFVEARKADGRFCVCGGQLIRIYSLPYLGKPKHKTSLVMSDGSVLKGKFEK
jgi:hypothetical protein